MHSIVLCLLCLTVTAALPASESYSERLQITPLPHNHVSTYFEFVTTKKTTPQSALSFDVFPKTIVDLVRRYGVAELDLSITQGHWRFPLESITGVEPSPTGASLAAWLNPKDGNGTVDQQWKDLVHALSGLMCASLVYIDERAMTAVPKFAYRARGFVPRNSSIRYGAVPHENLCTENLTPWKRLLPCHSSAGLATLLSPSRLLSASYFSLSLRILHTCDTTRCTDPTLTLQHRLHAVFRTERDRLTVVDVFGRDLERGCAVADSAKVIVRIADAANETSFNQAPTSVANNHDAVFDVSTSSSNFTLGRLRFNNDPVDVDLLPQQVKVHCFAGGRGQERGRLICQLTNGNAHKARVLYSHMVPWQFRLHLHTLAIECTPLGEADKAKRIEPHFNVFQLSKMRLRPYLVETVFEMNGRSQCRIGIDFEKHLLRWTEYPPDAHRGFFIPAAQFTIQPMDPFSSKKANNLYRVYGEIMLTTLPTPDFSMPYNVICLVCTVVALAFGPIHNLTTKQMVFKDADEVKKTQGWKGKLNRLKAFCAERFRRRPKGEEDRSDESKKKK